MASWLICCFIAILLYVERNWFLQRKLVIILPMNFDLFEKYQRFNAIGGSIEMLQNGWIFKNFGWNDNFKTFCVSQTANCLKKIIHPPADKSFLRLWNKYFLMKVYRNKQTFDFKVLRECSSCGSRNGAVKMFFLIPIEACFWLCCRSIFFIIQTVYHVMNKYI